MSRPVRVRFAPSPTGPLHIGGVRTALYNYLFAKKNGGKFLLRIEDTDQKRYVDKAEEYILESLEWLGLTPDESVVNPGDFGPYRQSDRKSIYQEYVQKLIDSGNAYYAFDTPDELEEMRHQAMEQGIHSQKYDASVRHKMRNSLTLTAQEVNELIQKGENVTVRMKVPTDELVSFKDIVRGQVKFDTSELDDKVILKADGLPTYHLANVVDDRLMQISHVIRGEEWLSSTAHHVLLYRFFGWEDEIAQFAHLPLIMKPSGKGKLSKRDGAKFGFPVFPLEWEDTKEKETYIGFRESGFLPAGLINFLSLLGWNPGDDQEIFSIEHLSEIFSLEKINKSGAQFNYDKAKWFNQQYIIAANPQDIYDIIGPDLARVSNNKTEAYIIEVIRMLQPRVHTLTEFKEQSTFFWSAPSEFDEKAIKKKFRIDNKEDFSNIISLVDSLVSFDTESLSSAIKGHINDNQLKFGHILPALRIWMTGSMAGPDLFEMMALLGQQETVQRLTSGLNYAVKFTNNE